MTNINKQMTEKVNESISTNAEVSQNLETATGSRSLTPENFSRLGGAISASSPAAQNAFYNDFLNKTVKQVVMDLDKTTKLNGLISKFGIGALSAGDVIEVVSTGTVDLIDIDMADGAANEQFTTKKNKVWIHKIELGNDKNARITTLPSQVRRAMTSPAEMSKLVAQISSKVSKSIDKYYWKRVKSEIVDYTAPVGSTLVEKVLGDSTTSADDLFVGITELAKDMEFPTDAYNEGVSVGGTITPLEQNYELEDLILVLNPKMDAKFQIKTFAALYHLMEVKAKKIEMITLPFTKVNGQPIANAEKTIGFLMSKDRLLTAWAHKGIKSYINPVGDFLHTSGNVALCYGNVPFVNRVKLTIT